MIKADEIIRNYGQHQLLRKGNDLDFDEINNVRHKLRALARLLQVLHELTHSVFSFAQLLAPEFYDQFVAAVLQIRAENKQLAIQLGHMVKSITFLNIAQCIKARDSARRQASEDFLQLYRSSWSEAVASATVRLQQKQKLNKAVDLPLSSDLVKITAYLDDELKKGITNEECNYGKLQKLLLTSLLLFNKRRPHEVSKIKVSDYRLSLDCQEDREEILDSLTLEERTIAKR